MTRDFLNAGKIDSTTCVCFLVLAQFDILFCFSCNVGYSGERCEVHACHSYCLNNGVCSLNEEKKPYCQCDADHEGSRCEVALKTCGECS